MSEEQQQAQRITDGLFLGPYQVAQDVTRLQQLGVTTVVSVLGEDQDFDKVESIDQPSPEKKAA